MAVKFYPHNHRYESVDIFDNIEWTSVTTLVGRFREPFDSKQSALDCSLKKKSKWYGIHPDKILEYWRLENKRSTDLGTWYHSREEEKLIAAETTERYGQTLTIHKPLYIDGVKIAPDQKLKDGIYPEHFVYLKTKGVCGQSDEVIVSNGILSIEDHKSNKDLKKPAYKSWDGRTKRLLPPLVHMEDCKLSEYALQMSTYAYIILKHNPNLKIGTLTLNHVRFEEEGRDQFDYPIMRRDENGNPILKDVEKIQVPYLPREVELMFEYKNVMKTV